MVNRNKKTIFIFFLIAVIVAIRLSPLGDILTFENLKKNREIFFAFVQGHYLQSAAAYVALYIVITAVSIPGAGIMTLAGGFLFGVLPATLYIDIGATIGATLAFLSARYLLGSWLQEKYKKQLSAFNAEMEKNGPRYLLTVRLIPVFPFFMINFLSGLTNIPARTFAWTTALGIIPATVIFAFAGRQLGTINAVSEVLSPRMIGALLVLAGLALFPGIYNRIKAYYQNRSR
jgi:uncharacterized membrane protein YdjX (TVP38/TMEM64 family)